MPAAAHQRYAARYVFPGYGAPLERGVVEIAGGVIAAVHNRPDPDAVNLGNVAIVPGLINAHAHLEFSDLASPIPPGDSFADWVRGVVAHRRARTRPVAAIIRDGLAESARAGTTWLGEIATGDDVDVYHNASFPNVIAFRELLGFGRAKIAEQLATARKFVERRRACRGPALSGSSRRGSNPPNSLDGQRRCKGPDPSVAVGLSPHAPYSLHPDVWPEAVRIANAAGSPVAAHLAETREELEFLDCGGGPLAELLREFGVWEEGVIAPGTRPLDYLRVLAGAKRGLVVHGNYLTGDEQRFLAERDNLSLVYCPRTHAHFRHDPHPWRAVLQRGGNVALGTDGRASNPDLSLWRELQFLREQAPDLPDEQLLALGTVNGARALGTESAGALSPGKRADLTVVDLQDPRSLFHRGNQVVGTMVGGRFSRARFVGGGSSLPSRWSGRGY